MRREPYFYELIRAKKDQKVYGDTPYEDRIKDFLLIYEQLSSMEKLEFKEAIRKILKSGDQVLIEIAIAICSTFIDTGFNKQQQFIALQSKMLQGLYGTKNNT